MENDKIKTVLGVFKDNEVVDQDTGEIFSCLTYGIHLNKIQDKLGFYNLKYNSRAKCWIVFQYILLD